MHNFEQGFVGECEIGPTTLLDLFGFVEPVNFIPAVSLWLKVFGEFLFCRFEIVVFSVVGNLLKNFSNSWSGSV